MKRLTRKRIAEMAERWVEREFGQVAVIADAESTADVVARFGAMIASRVRREERDARLAATETGCFRIALPEEGRPPLRHPPGKCAQGCSQVHEEPADE